MDFPPWFPPWAAAASAAVIGYALLADKGVRAIRWLWRATKWAGLKVRDLALAVIDLFRHRHRIEALERHVAELQGARKESAGPKTVPHLRIRWALSEVSDDAVAHCDPCFQKTGGHLLQLDARTQDDGKMWIYCPVCKLAFRGFPRRVTTS